MKNHSDIKTVEDLEEYCDERNCGDCILDEDCRKIAMKMNHGDLFYELLPIILIKNRKEKLAKLLK